MTGSEGNVLGGRELRLTTLGMLVVLVIGVFGWIFGGQVGGILGGCYGDQNPADCTRLPEAYSIILVILALVSLVVALGRIQQAKSKESDSSSRIRSQESLCPSCGYKGPMEQFFFTGGRQPYEAGMRRDFTCPKCGHVEEGRRLG
jgi:predicted RNA-binding Zn-ribbon protein involved in translation (DUF1610 family)